ncbi:MAG: TIGR04219 family outer membrane beta-barrel protein [Marinicellaceae bacterium]
MKKYLVLLAIFFNTHSMADTVFGVEAGIQSWYYDNSGDIASPFDPTISDGNFDIDNESALTYFIALEHGVPLVPNFKLRHTKMDDQINCAADVACLGDIDINLSHTDITAYYELLDNWVNLDLGLSGIYFSGNSQIQSAINIASEDYSEIIPALYGKAEFEFPTTDISASLTANVGTLTDNSVVDLELAVKYKFTLGFGLEAGLRRQTVDFNDFDTVNVDSTSTGVYAALNFDF